MGEIIECRTVTFRYSPHDKIVIENISFFASEGQLITLLGPNGVGKLTLLDCMCGLIEPCAGTVFLCGNDISKMTQRDIAKIIAYVPQRLSIPFDYSVRDFVVMGRTSHLGILQSPEKEDYRLVEEALEKLEIRDLIERPINMLSGGEQQKVAIARALVQNPKMIILDEPTSALDYGNQVRVLRLVKELSNNNYCVLLTSHNPDQCLMLKSTVAILDRSGRLTMGSCDEVLTEASLSQLYDVKLKLVYSEDFNRVICLPQGI